MIQLFDPDVGTPGGLSVPAETPRSHSLEERGEQGHRVSSFLSRPFRLEGVRPDASFEPVEEPSWFGTIRESDSIRDPDHKRGGASDIHRLPER
jgi:hypothetical protein